MHTGRRFALGLLVASGIALPARLLSGTNVWTVPGTANVAGQNGTRFVSDLALTNPGTSPAQLTISLVPAGGTTPNPVTLKAGETVVYRNLLDRIWGAQGSGATQVSSDSPLLICARTYNTAASGTYGVALPVFTDEDLLVFGDLGHSLWVSQSADGTRGYRSNIAVVFPDPSGGEATVTLYDADGNEIGSKDYALAAAGFQQFPVAGISGPVSAARAEIQVVRGRAAGYSVVVDNVTGDSSLFTFEGLPAGWQDVLINGVARVNGQFSTFFRTDGRFYNPTSEDATVTASFHDRANANPAPLTKDFTVPAGKILDVVDILGSFFALPAGSAGAVRFRSSSPVGILCRTSNVDPTGTKPGTFGAQQRPSQLLSFLMSADAGGVVTGIRQNASFRTNVGFAAGEDGATLALTLKNPAGETVATAIRSLGPSGWEQPGIGALFPGTGIPDDAQLLVKVVSGSVDVFDSSLDNLSGDSIVTRIALLPAEIPSSATIGSEGGSIRSSDGIFTLKVPAGALTTPTTISIAITTNDAPGALGPGYEISPGGLAFAKPALLRLRFGAGALAAGGIDRASLAVLTGAGWAGLTGGRVDTSSRSLLIKLWSTSPSASLVAARTPLAATSASRFGALAAFEIRNQDLLLPFSTGARPNWVPTDRTAFLVAFFRLTPSSAGEEGPVVRLLDVQKVTVTWFRPKLGSFAHAVGQSNTYKAPASISRNYVVDTLTVRFQDAATGERRETLFEMNVIRRDWKLLASFSLDLRCEGGSNDFTLGYSAVAANDFFLDDDLRLNSYGSQPDPIKTAKTVWGGCNACTVLSHGEVGDLVFGEPTGRFVTLNGPPYFFLEGSMGLRSGFPEKTTRCPNGIGGILDTPYPAQDIVLFLPSPSDLYWPLSNGSLFSGDQGLGPLIKFDGIWSSTVR